MSLVKGLNLKFYSDTAVIYLTEDVPDHEMFSQALVRGTRKSKRVREIYLYLQRKSEN